MDFKEFPSTLIILRNLKKLSCVFKEFSRNLDDLEGVSMNFRLKDFIVWKYVCRNIIIFHVISLDFSVFYNILIIFSKNLGLSLHLKDFKRFLMFQSISNDINKFEIFQDILNDFKKFPKISNRSLCMEKEGVKNWKKCIT